MFLRLPETVTVIGYIGRFGVNGSDGEGCQSGQPYFPMLFDFSCPIFFHHKNRARHASETCPECLNKNIGVTEARALLSHPKFRIHLILLSVSPEYKYGVYHKTSEWVLRRYPRSLKYLNLTSATIAAKPQRYTRKERTSTSQALG